MCFRNEWSTGCDVSAALGSDIWRVVSLRHQCTSRIARRIYPCKLNIDNFTFELGRQEDSSNFRRVLSHSMEEPEPCSFNLRLIEAVRSSRCLYDAKDRLYRSADHKIKVWNRLVQILQFDGIVDLFILFGLYHLYYVSYCKYYHNHAMNEVVMKAVNNFL